MQLSLMSDSRLNLVNPRFWCISYSAIVRYNLILESWDNYGARPGLALLYKFLLIKLASFFFCLQVEHLRPSIQGGARYRSTMQGLATIVRNQGWTQLFAGLSINYIKVLFFDLFKYIGRTLFSCSSVLRPWNVISNVKSAIKKLIET